MRRQSSLLATAAVFLAFGANDAAQTGQKISDLGKSTNLFYGTQMMAAKAEQNPKKIKENMDYAFEVLVKQNIAGLDIKKPEDIKNKGNEKAALAGSQFQFIAGSVIGAEYMGVLGKKSWISLSDKTDPLQQIQNHAKDDIPLSKEFLGAVNWVVNSAYALPLMAKSGMKIEELRKGNKLGDLPDYILHGTFPANWSGDEKKLVKPYFDALREPCSGDVSELKKVAGIWKDFMGRNWAIAQSLAVPSQTLSSPGLRGDVRSIDHRPGPGA